MLSLLRQTANRVNMSSAALISNLIAEVQQVTVAASASVHRTFLKCAFLLGCVA
jgi:hypothetical protein